MYELTNHNGAEDDYTSLSTSNTNRNEMSSTHNDQKAHNRSDKVVVLWKVNIVITVILCTVCIVFVSLSTITYHQLKQIQRKGNSFNEEMVNNKLKLTSMKQEVENVLQELNLTSMRQKVENVLREKFLNQCISDGYEFDEYADICYKIYNFNATWEKANDFCRDQSGRLLILDNSKKFDRFRNILSSDNINKAVSVGCRKSDLLPTFQWLNGKIIDEESNVWGIAQPNRRRDERNEECGAIGIRWSTKQPRYLHDISCTHDKIGLVCEKLLY